MSENPESYDPGGGKTDPFRHKQRRRKTDHQRDHTAPQRFTKQQQKQAPPFHPKHEIHAEFPPAAIDLITAGKVHEEKYKKQRYHIHERQQSHKFLYGIVLDRGKKVHDIQFPQGKQRVKRDDGCHKGAEKQSVSLAVFCGVSPYLLKEHARCTSHLRHHGRDALVKTGVCFVLPVPPQFMEDRPILDKQDPRTETGRTGVMRHHHNRFPLFTIDRS